MSGLNQYPRNIRHPPIIVAPPTSTTNGCPLRAIIATPHATARRISVAVTLNFPLSARAARTTVTKRAVRGLSDILEIDGILSLVTPRDRTSEYGIIAYFRTRTQRFQGIRHQKLILSEPPSRGRPAGTEAPLILQGIERTAIPAEIQIRGNQIQISLQACFRPDLSDNSTIGLSIWQENVRFLEGQRRRGERPSLRPARTKP